MPVAPHDFIILLRVLVDVAKLANDSGKNLKSWFVGRKVLVAGPSRAGKTTFRNYLREGHLEPERSRPRTSETDPSKSFAVKSVEGTPLQLEVRSIVDVPGQHLLEQMEAFETHRPDAIVLMLDGSMPIDEISFKPENFSLRQWVETYCEHLSDILQRDQKLASNLTNIFVILNKKDKTSPAQLSVLDGEMRNILSSRLRRGWGSRVDQIDILLCCSVASTEGSVSIDTVIREIARGMKGD